MLCNGHGDLKKKRKIFYMYARVRVSVCIGFISYCPCRADIVINWQKKFQSVKLCLGNIHVKNLTRAKTRGYGSNNKITVIGSKTYNVPEGPAIHSRKGKMNFSICTRLCEPQDIPFYDCLPYETTGTGREG